MYRLDIYTYAARDVVEMCVDSTGDSKNLRCGFLETPGGDEKRQMVDVGVT